MDTLILGGDARMPALAALLRERGEDARHIGDAREAWQLLPGTENVVTNNPPKAALTLEEIVSRAAPGAVVFTCGPVYCDMEGPVIDLWRDEVLLKENAYLTAEGAVSCAMQACNRCLRGLPCAVIGWGRIGSALAKLLLAMGAKVAVVSRSEAHRRFAAGLGMEAAGLRELPYILKKSLLIFSTPPARVLHEEMLGQVNREAIVIDLASPPYGVDLPAAWALGLRAWREPGLPGRYCPVSAAQALLNAMDRGRGRHD